MINVIGDIAGQYKTMMALKAKMPSGAMISVGDMVDRGPESKQVLDHFMSSDTDRAIMGNHEDMMLDFLKKSNRYEPGVWSRNGGGATLQSFGGPEQVDSKYVEFLSSLPSYLVFEFDGKTFFISHASKHPRISLDELLSDKVDLQNSLLWCRQWPSRDGMEKYNMQIFGHNSHFGFRKFSDELGGFALCLDTSGSKVLTGICLPTMQVFSQEYLD